MLRVSSKDQGNVQHGSLEQQKNVGLRWAKLQEEQTGIKHNIVKIVEEEKSGKKSAIHKRSDYCQALKAIKTKSIDFIVYEKVDRMGRWQIANLQLMELALENNVEVFELESGLIDFKNRGSRMSFNIKNMMAEEYSLELEEKITTKQREAKVNNGKDSSTYPILGLDPHPTKTCMYMINYNELKQVVNIMEKFCELQSYIELSKYCKDKGYTTKVRLLKEKIDKHGNRQPARKIGNETLTPTLLKTLLINPKYRGFDFFEDTWNQFPKLQDENGMVKWNYAHGQIVDSKLLDKVDATVEKIAKVSRHKTAKDGTVYLLSGALKGYDGKSFHGETANGHQYYKSKSLGIRVKRKQVEDIVIKRIKQYLKESGTLHNLMQTALKHRLIGIPIIDENIAALEKQKKNY